MPRTIANVEIVPPADVTDDDQATGLGSIRTTAAGASYAMQAADAPTASYHPLASSPGLEARDCRTWEPSAELVATWIVRPATGAVQGHDVRLSIPGETGGLSILFMASGAATFEREGGEPVTLHAGDCLTCSAGLVRRPDPAVARTCGCWCFTSSARAEALQERPPPRSSGWKRWGRRSSPGAWCVPRTTTAR